MEQDNYEKLNSLARDVLKLSRNTLLVNLRFLDMALSQLQWIEHNESSYFTNGEMLIYNPMHVLKTYKNEKMHLSGIICMLLCIVFSGICL